MGLIAPNRYVEKDIEEFEVDGVKMVFQNTPDTEAPREMNTYIPGMKALWMAENVIASLHNIYTLRGAPVRDPSMRCRRACRTSGSAAVITVLRNTTAVASSNATLVFGIATRLPLFRCRRAIPHPSTWR